MKKIKADLDAGTFQQVYLLYGAERYLVLQYRDRLVRALVPEEDQIRLVIALGKPAHTSTVVPLGEDGKTDYYLDEERNYYVPKRAFEDVVTFA